MSKDVFLVMVFICLFMAVIVLSSFFPIFYDDNSPPAVCFRKCNMACEDLEMTYHLSGGKHVTNDGSRWDLNLATGFFCEECYCLNWRGESTRIW